MFSLISFGTTKGQEPNSSLDENQVSPFAPYLDRKLVQSRHGVIIWKKALVPITLLSQDGGRERTPSNQDPLPPSPPLLPLLYQGLFSSGTLHDAAPGVIHPTWETFTTSTPEEQIQMAKLPMATVLTRGRTRDSDRTGDVEKGVDSMPWWKTFHGAVYILPSNVTHPGVPAWGEDKRQKQPARRLKNAQGHFLSQSECFPPSPDPLSKVYSYFFPTLSTHTPFGSVTSI